ncbi:MAG: nucleoside deaminase [Armatimonadetes bacterium]|nr:nucleoside deaminase [Armatimonadota bacterium]
MNQHEHFMQLALEEARIASQRGEVPVGAVLVRDGVVIARAHNRVEQLGNPTAHAELLLIQEATAVQQGKWLHECALYVTLEPCPMCAGAILLARIPQLYFGAFDAKAGAAGTLFCVTTDPRMNHTVGTWGGICASQSTALLQQFFREQRGAT